MKIENKHSFRFAFLAILFFSVATLQLGCESKNSTVEAASDAELAKSEADMLGMSEEEFDEGMAEMGQ